MKEVYLLCQINQPLEIYDIFFSIYSAKKKKMILIGTHKGTFVQEENRASSFVKTKETSPTSLWPAVICLLGCLSGVIWLNWPLRDTHPT